MRRIIVLLLGLLLLPVAFPATDGSAARAAAPVHQASSDFSDLANLSSQNLTPAAGGGLELQRDLKGFDWGAGAVDTTAYVDKFLPDIAVASSGDYAVVWEESSGGYDAVVLQRFTPDGKPNGTQVYIGATSSNPTGPRVESNSRGEFIVIWQNTVNVTYARLYATVVAPDGQKRLDRRILVDGRYPDGQAVCMLPNDSFVLVWCDYRANSTGADLYSRLFDANCTPIANETNLVLNKGNCWDAIMVRRPTGEILLAYDLSVVLNMSVYLQRLLPNGTAQGEPIVVAYGTAEGVQNSYPCLGLAPGGDLLVVWQVGWKIDENHDYVNITGQWFDANLTPKDGPFEIGAEVYGYQSFPHMAMAPDGGFVVEWSLSDDENNTHEVYQRRFDPDGSPNGTATLVGPPSDRRTGSVAVSSSGDFILAWDDNSTSKSMDMYSGVVRRLEPYRGTGWVETPELSPAGIVRWDELRANYTLTNTTGNTVYFFYSTDGGTSWEAVPANGSLAPADSMAPLLLRACLSTTDNSSSPVLGSFSMNYTVDKGPVLQPMEDRTVDKNTLVTLEAVASDEDGDPLFFEWQQTAGPLAVLVNDTTATVGFTAPAVGNYSLRVSVTDGLATVYGTVNITARNLPPRAALSVDRTDPVAGMPVLFDASASSDPDGHITDYNFSFGDGNATGWVTGWKVGHTYAAIGTYGAVVMVRDDDGEVSFSPTVVIRAVRFNQPPVMTSTPVPWAIAEQEWNYTMTAQDNDSDPVTFGLLTGPEGMMLDNASGRLSWTPKATQTGVFQIKVSARDPLGGVDEQGFNVTVAPPLRCNIISPANGAVMSGTATVRGNASGGWEGAVRVEYDLDGSGWKVAHGVNNWSFTVDGSKLKAGKHIVQARACDGTDYSAVASLTFNVAKPGNEWVNPVVGVLVVLGVACGLAVWWRLNRKR